MFVQQALETRSTAHKEVLGNCPYLKLHCVRNRCAQRRRYRPFLVTARLKHTFSGSPCRRSSRWYARAIACEGTATFCLKFASHTQRATAALQRYLTACCLICLSCLLSGSFRRSKSSVGQESNNATTSRRSTSARFRFVWGERARPFVISLL